MKKGGIDILSTETYMYDYFLCEEYNYDCGYMEDANGYILVANGIALSMSEA